MSYFLNVNRHIRIFQSLKSQRMVTIPCIIPYTFCRVRKPKNQLSQINSLTSVGCLLEYPIAKITTKLEARLLSSQNYALLLWTRRTIYF